MAEEPQKEPSSTSQQYSDHKKPDVTDIKSQASASSRFAYHPNGGFPMYPVWYPSCFAPGLHPMQYEEQTNRGAGIYAVPVHPFMGHVAALPSNNLIPLTYNIPNTRPSNGIGTGGEDQVQAGQQQEGQQQQQPDHQRQVIVRRFQIAFQLDLFLIFKLAAVIFLFNQDGSRQRLVVLVFFASIIYLYQTGAFAPLVRWLSQGMQRAAAAPPRHQRPAAGRADNDPAAERLHNDNAAPGREENEAQGADNGEEANRNEIVVEAEAGNQWWGIVKEIQMIVFGFITSLLPGFHNLD